MLWQGALNFIGFAAGGVDTTCRCVCMYVCMYVCYEVVVQYVLCFSTRWNYKVS